jgi:hypothetical protein
MFSTIRFFDITDICAESSCPRQPQVLPSFVNCCFPHDQVIGIYLYIIYLIVLFSLIRYLYGLDASAIRIVSIVSHAISSVLVYTVGIQVQCNLFT